MIKLPFFFGRKKLFLAFEYGVILSEVAKEQGIELTPEIIERAEKMIENEFRLNGPTHLATQIVPLIMTVFELDLSK